MVPISFIEEGGNIAARRTWEGGDVELNVEYATTLRQKLIGLALRDNFDGVMVFTYAKPVNIIIHTIGMKFNLDIICYNAKNEVIKEVKNMKQWRFVYVKGVKTFTEQASEQ